MKKNEVGYYRLTTILLIATKICLHFFTNTNYELHRDEMLYFDMGNHLDFGYITIPPFTAAVAFFVKTIFGYSVFGIRLMPCIAGAASIFLIAQTIRLLKGGIIALVIAEISFIFSGGFLIFDTLFTPNVFEQLFWILITYLAAKLICNENTKGWPIIGALCGLAFLNKYSIVFFVIAMLLAMLQSPKRYLLYNKYFLFAIFLFLLISLPNILWQYHHNWPVVYHMQELKRTQLINVKFAGFLEDLFSLTYMATIVWLLGLVALLFSSVAKPLRIVGIAYLLIFLFYIFSHGKAYYVLGMLPFLFAVGGYAIEKYCAGKRAWINYCILVLIAVPGIIALPFSLPVLGLRSLDNYYSKFGAFIVYPFSRWEDGKKHPVSQIYADMTGWAELASKTATAYYSLNMEDKKNCTIYCERNYGYAGCIDFYGRQYGLPKAITFLESYTLWAPDTIPKGPLIYINYSHDAVSKLFLNVTESGEVKDPYFREKGLKIFICRIYITDVQEVYKRKLAGERQNYR